MSMRHVLIAALALLATGTARPADAQVLRELDPIDLDYVVGIKGEADPAGTYATRFEVVDTPRGRRLQVTATLHYVFGQDADDFVEFHRETTVWCDEEGIERFEATTRQGDREESVSAFRRGIDYHLTVRRGDESKQRTETAGVRRSPLGFFAAAFQETPMTEGDLIVDFPTLVPAAGRHTAHQRYLSGKAPAQTASGETVRVAMSNLLHVSTARDYLWHRVDHPYQPLLRMEEQVFHGVLVYQIARVNGEPVDWASAAVPLTP
ncbi:MAG: hypothetical protein HKN12_10810 [Gemmatimonadetes bacterium]|nr:hypothetical protein [Gemmatimonadota bacterium]